MSACQQIEDQPGFVRLLFAAHNSGECSCVWQKFKIHKTHNISAAGKQHALSPLSPLSSALESDDPFHHSTAQNPVRGPPSASTLKLGQGHLYSIRCWVIHELWSVGRRLIVVCDELQHEEWLITQRQTCAFSTEPPAGDPSRRIALLAWPSRTREFNHVSTKIGDLVGHMFRIPRPLAKLPLLPLATLMQSPPRRSSSQHDGEYHFAMPRS